MSADRQYELVYIVPPETPESDLTGLHEQIDGIVTRLGGKIEKTENWGRRRLAYEIARHKEAIYVLELIQGPGDLVKELDRRLRVMDQVLRHLVIRVDEELKVAGRSRSRRETRTARRRAARGLPAEGAEPRATPAAAGGGSSQETEGEQSGSPR